MFCDGCRSACVCTHGRILDDNFRKWKKSSFVVVVIVVENLNHFTYNVNYSCFTESDVSVKITYRVVLSDNSGGGDDDDDADDWVMVVYQWLSHINPHLFFFGVSVSASESEVATSCVQQPTRQQLSLSWENDLYIDW